MINSKLIRYFMRLLLAVGIVLSFANCSMMFGQMAQSQVNQTQINQSHSMMTHSGMMSDSSHHQTPIAGECCNLIDMENLQVIKAVPSHKALVSPLLLFVLLSSVTYFSFVTQRRNKFQFHEPPPPPFLSLLDLKTSFTL